MLGSIKIGDDGLIGKWVAFHCLVWEAKKAYGWIEAELGFAKGEWQKDSEAGGLGVLVRK